MLVRMKHQIGGFRNGEEWPPIGGTIDVGDNEAADLISNGYAEEARDEHTGAGPQEGTVDGSSEAPADGSDATTGAGSPTVATAKPRTRKPRARK